MSIAQLFKDFRDNLSVRNAADISSAYASITTRLNKDFRSGLESATAYRRQIGSYGRSTAIHGVSDLDMAYELPWELYEQYRKYQNNGPSQLLQAVRASLKTRYPGTEIKGDGQVVVINFKGFVVEVLPAFVDKEAGGYRFPDSNDGGSWRVCKPVAEMEAVDKRNVETNRNYKHVCKMLRAWKNTHGVAMSGMLIDTLAYNFFGAHTEFNDASYGAYDKLFETLFAYLGGLDHQEFWAAPGSGQRVHPKGKFQSKAKKAAAKCQEARAAESEKKQARLWREVFGRAFPQPVALTKAVANESMAADAEFAEHRPGEQFIEDQHQVDIQYDLVINCEVSKDGRGSLLRRLLLGASVLPQGHSLEFHVESCNVPVPFEMKWKVVNVGHEAIRRQMTRGQIMHDSGKHKLTERTNFGGQHFVEAYVIKNGICVARDLIDVPIEF